MSDVVRVGTSNASDGVGELLRLLRDGRERTRSEIADLMGLSRSTVTSRVDALIAAGLAVPAGEARSSGGRPPSRIAFHPRSRAIIAVDLGATHGVVSVSDLNARSLATHTEAIAIAQGPEQVLEWVIASAQRLLATQGYHLEDLVAIGLGVPGPIEHSSGRPTKPPIMPGWDRFDIPGLLRERLQTDVPVLVDNDVNILALGEQATAWPGVEELLFVKVSTGIGAGIISGGVLQRGAQGTAGDMGHVQVPRSPGSTRPPDDESDLEAIASGPAIAARLRARGVEAHTSRDVIEFVQQGNPAAIEETRNAGREIGEVLATTVNLLNPSVIVIGGSIPRASEQLIAGVREVVYRRSIPLATQHLAIVQSRGGALAGVLGAGILAANHVFAPENIGAFLRNGAD